MSFSLFKYKNKSAAELVQQTRDGLQAFHDKEAKEWVPNKVMEELGKNMAAIKVIVANEDADANPETVAALLVEAYKEDFMILLATRVWALDWDARKNVVQIWASLLQHRVGGGQRGVAYVENHPEILGALLRGYEMRDSAITSGTMLREALRYESLARCFLQHPSFHLIFTYADVASFDVASDAFITLKDSLRRHKAIVSEHLADDFTQFFELFETLLTSENYVTRRQSLKLLGEVLLDRSNVNVMLRFINDAHNLRLIMTLLRDPTKSIQFEAFHVFKVFVANPTKSDQIIKILARNRVRLLAYLQEFHTDREDEQFQEEKDLLLKEIEALPPMGASA